VIAASSRSRFCNALMVVKRCFRTSEVLRSGTIAIVLHLMTHAGLPMMHARILRGRSEKRQTTCIGAPDRRRGRALGSRLYAAPVHGGASLAGKDSSPASSTSSSGSSLSGFFSGSVESGGMPFSGFGSSCSLIKIGQLN
jgi:hypothetical protein